MTVKGDQVNKAKESNSPVPPGARASQWWRDNCQQASPHDKPNRRMYDPAIRARLRRCRSNTDAAMIPAAVALAVRLGALREHTRPNEPNIEAALGLARVLAFVTDDTDKPPMRAAGWQQFPGDNPGSQPPDKQPRLAEARFKRLLGVKPGEEQVVAFARLVKLLGGSVNVAALSRDFLQWGRDETRRRWAFDYYAASSAAPPSADISPSEENT